MEASKASEGFTRADIRRILKIHERSLKAWERHRLIELHGRIGFSDLAALRTLKSLRESRIPALRIKASLAALRKRTGVRRPLVDLSLRPQGRKIAVQTSGALMEAETGQFLLPFDPHAPGRVRTLEPRSAAPPPPGSTRPKSGFSAAWKSRSAAATQPTPAKPTAHRRAIHGRRSPGSTSDAALPRPPFGSREATSGP